MKSVQLTAYSRTLTRRSGVKKVRAQDRIPAVIYGRHNPPQNLEINLKDLEKLIHHSASENILVDLDLVGSSVGKRLALVQDVQHHPLSGKVLHLDLHEIKEDERVTVMVPVESVGEPVGVKTGGGVLEHVLFKIRVRSLPKDLPEMITVDVTNLEVGKSIHIGDIAPIPGVEIIGDKKIVVLSVAAPRTEAQEAAATAAEGAAQPEMIKEKKEEGATPAGAGDKGGAKAGGAAKAAAPAAKAAAPAAKAGEKKK